MVIVSVPDRQAQLCDFARLIEKILELVGCFDKEEHYT